jgi:serine/threonine protein kinase
VKLHALAVPTLLSDMTMPDLYSPFGDYEDLREYRPGGYHPVQLNDHLLNGRFQIAHKLGWGGYSLVWLAWDGVCQRYVALKMAKANLSSYLQSEVAVLRALESEDVPTVLDEFEHEGPNGTHACYTMPVAAGDLAMAKIDDLFPIDVARALAAKLALMTSGLHARSYCHGGR